MRSADARFLVRLAALIFAVAVALAAGAVDAQQVRCPVCAESFDVDETPVCPNDGTDLRREGRKVEPPIADAGVEEERDDPEMLPEAPPRYRRHDIGGERQRSEKQPGEYTDRERRIGDERRGQAAAAAAAQRRQREQEREQARLAARDERLREDFEKRRRELQGKDRRAGPWWSTGDRPAADGVPLWERTAPLVSLGARLSWMGEDGHPGPLAGAEMDINLVRTSLRVGLSSFLGVRHLAERAEMVFFQSFSAGFQLPGRWSPHLLGRLGLGMLSAERFGESVQYLARFAGVETGIDCHVNGSVVVTPAVGYARYAVDNAYWDTVTLRIGIGFN